MKCPKCDGKVRVIDYVHSRYNEEYRKRKCTECGHIFYTCECVVEYDASFKEEWNLSHRTSYVKRRMERKMKCKECKHKDALIERYKTENERIVKLNGEILETARSINHSNFELIMINKKLHADIEELKNKLKEATGETCSDDSDNV